jgi:energy-coupling factor transporter ATP-binding protein EcfA2
MMTKRNPGPPDGGLRHITQIKVRKLFGHLDYDVPRTKRESAQDDLLIIYGDNGSGKTTLLRMLFNTLSTKPGSGRKTFLAQIPFETFEVEFSGGASVTVGKQGKLIGGYQVTIVVPGGKSEKFTLKTAPDGALKQEDNPVPELLRSLSRLQVSLYFLPDDRRVQADFADETLESPRRRSRHRLLYDEAYRAMAHIPPMLQEHWTLEPGTGTVQEESHHLEIGPVLLALVSSLRRQVIQGSNTGEGNASSIYLRVVEGLKSVSWPSEESTQTPEHALIQRIEALDVKIQQFSRFGLHAGFPAEKFIAAFKEATHHNQVTILGILEPYLEGLEARLSALQELHDIISTYVETLNSFFSNKSLGLDIQRGITVTSRWGEPIDANLLSSGERQLLLLLSNTILARKKSSIFIIDEPELSLNVTWQRKLVSALLRCSHGGGIQYILASHSLELITQYQERTTRLLPLGERVING